MPVFPRRVSIPERFHSDAKETVFSECLQCETSLLESSTEYLIEKAYRYYEAYDVEETIFEYALCLDCHQEMAAAFSDLSRRRCTAYFNERIDLYDRAAALMDLDNPEPDAWMQQCIVHDTPADALDEYQILAYCVGDEMVLSHLPLLIGGPAMREVSERLSPKTRNDLGGLQKEHAGVPPELQTTPQGPVLA